MWSELLVNMIKEGCGNKSSLLILLIYYLKNSQKSNLSLENKNLKWGEISSWNDFFGVVTWPIHAMVERYWSSVQTPSFCNLTNLLILDSQYFLLEIVSAQCKETENRTLRCGGAPAGPRRGWPNRFPSKDAPHLDTITEEEGSDWDRPSSQNIRLWKMPHFNLSRATVPGPTSDSYEPTSFPGYWRYLKSSVCFPGTKSIGIDPLCFHLIAWLKKLDSQCNVPIQTSISYLHCIVHYLHCSSTIPAGYSRCQLSPNSN